MSLEIPRPVDPSLHPFMTGNYRIATPAIEEFYELVARCLHYRVMGALIHGPSRIGKTRAIEYVRPLIARNYPRMTSYHAQCEHKPRHAEGPFFANLLEAVGDPDPNAGSNTSKRVRLALRIREAAARADSGVVLLFCDEAQRYNDNEYEWLRDVHDTLDRQQIRQDPDRRASDGRRSRVLRHSQCSGCSDVSQWIRSDRISGEKSLELHALLCPSGV